MTPAPTSRPCRDYERPWRGRCVDRNLKDEWLDQLNALSTCSLTSICEGHVHGSGERLAAVPLIKLRLKPELVPAATREWPALSQELTSLLPTLFDLAETRVEAALRLEVRASDAAVRERQELVIKIHSVRVRETEELDGETAAWFETSVAACVAIDEFLKGRFDSQRLI